ncbi:hypothetical protein ACHAWF_015462 [Thalassiosira exigua]
MKFHPMSLGRALAASLLLVGSSDAFQAPAGRRRRSVPNRASSSASASVGLRASPLDALPSLDALSTSVERLASSLPSSLPPSLDLSTLSSALSRIDGLHLSSSSDVTSALDSLGPALRSSPWHVAAVSALFFAGLSNLLLSAFVNAPEDYSQAPYPGGSDSYDPSAAEEFYARRPLAVFRRILRLASLTSAFNAGLVVDWLILGKWAGDEDYEALRKNEPRRAKEALELCEQLGPTFIKLVSVCFGRIFATRRPCGEATAFLARGGRGLRPVPLRKLEPRRSRSGSPGNVRRRAEPREREATSRFEVPRSAPASLTGGSWVLTAGVYPDAKVLARVAVRREGRNKLEVDKRASNDAAIARQFRRTAAGNVQSRWKPTGSRFLEDARAPSSLRRTECAGTSSMRGHVRLSPRPSKRFIPSRIERGLGQALSIRTDLLPEPYVLELRKLQDAVPPFPSSEAREVLREELGVSDLSKIFAELSDEPVASASIGQVYRGKLKDGTDVAVKVQRPGILGEITLDLRVLRLSNPLQTTLQNAANGRKTDRADEAINTAAFVRPPRRGRIGPGQGARHRVGRRDAIGSRRESGHPAAVRRGDQRVFDDAVGHGDVALRSAPGELAEDCGRVSWDGVCTRPTGEVSFERGQFLPWDYRGGFCHISGKRCILDWSVTLAVPDDLQYALLEFIAHINTEDYDSIPQDFINLGFSPEDVSLERLESSGITEGISFAFRQLSKGGGQKKMQERVKEEFKERHGADLSDTEPAPKAREDGVEAES